MLLQPQAIRQIAAIDLDGVLCDCIGGINTTRNLKGLPDIPPPSDYNFSDLPLPDREAIYKLFANPSFYRQLRPLEGALPALWTLAHRYDIAYITGRASSATRDIYNGIDKVTRDWLFNWQAPPGELIHCLPDTKATKLIDEYGYDRVEFGVDDDPRAIDSYQRCGVLSYIVRASYNTQYVCGDDVVAVVGLAEVARLSMRVGDMKV